MPLSTPTLVAVPDKPTAVVDSTAASSVHLFWIVPRGSVIESYKVVWERDTSGECPDEDIGSTTITDSVASYTIRGLEEDSSYTITVTVTNVAGSTVSEPDTGVTRETG